MQHKEIDKFRNKVYTYYKQHSRSLPWRETIDPYNILVSEIMLQQTQVDRVIPKYNAFIEKFPTLEKLAGAPLSTVLSAWSGLGYNRRAKWLKECAEIIITKHKGIFPQDIRQLDDLPGVGSNTAAAVLVYSFNLPYVFIETNIRTVFIHHFFEDRDDVSDADILQLVEQILDSARIRKNPREWYWALMDYGTFIKKQHKNPSRRSVHYTRQSRFEGSNRQIRGKIIKLLLKKGTSSVKILARDLNITSEVLQMNLQNLSREGLIVQDKEKVSVA